MKSIVDIVLEIVGPVNYRDVSFVTGEPAWQFDHETSKKQIRAIEKLLKKEGHDLDLIQVYYQGEADDLGFGIGLIIETSDEELNMEDPINEFALKDPVLAWEYNQKVKVAKGKFAGHKGLLKQCVQKSKDQPFRAEIEVLDDNNKPARFYCFLEDLDNPDNREAVNVLLGIPENEHGAWYQMVENYKNGYS